MERHLNAILKGSICVLGCATVAAMTSACASRSAMRASGEYGAPTTEMAVRGFLDGANAEDYSQMSDLFGTDEGAAVERFGVTDVERRMIFLSALLKHQSYNLQQANLAQLGPDRVRWEARLEGTRKGTVVVPVITVPDATGRWFVERLNVDALTASTVP